jgi:hypothetical protein
LPQVRYWVERGAHTRHGTFTALLTPRPEYPGQRLTSPAVKVETALDCWWAWRHPELPAVIAARRGSVVWLDFLDPQSGRPAQAFPAYADRYQRARKSFLIAAGVGWDSSSRTASDLDVRGGQ